jgi:hypothetical protein
MGANFTIETSKVSKLDKFIIVHNFNGLNQIFNQGFSYAKKKIEKKSDVVGAWKIKFKN